MNRLGEYCDVCGLGFCGRTGSYSRFKQTIVWFRRKDDGDYGIANLCNTGSFKIMEERDHGALSGMVATVGELEVDYWRAAVSVCTWSWCTYRTLSTPSGTVASRCWFRVPPGTWKKECAHKRISFHSRFCFFSSVVIPPFRILQ